MSRILTSLHGRKVGLTDGGLLMAPSGFVSGEHGKQLSSPSPSRVVFFDDFIGDVTLDQYNLLEGTDSATSTELILAGGIGGVLQITTGDAGTGLAADMAQVTQYLQWQASNGDLVFQTRLKLSAISTCYVFVGFTDLAATLEAPIESAASANTLTSNATDAVGFMFDTRMTDDKWWLVGVATDVDATHVIATYNGTQYAPVADDYETLRIEVKSSGVANFFINGNPVGTLSAAVTAAADLTPTINVSKTSVAASMTAEIDYLAVEMARAADGAAV